MATLPAFCEQCGAQLPARARFCEQCGAPVVLAPAQAQAPEPPAAVSARARGQEVQAPPLPESDRVGAPAAAAEPATPAPPRPSALVPALVLVFAVAAGLWWMLAGRGGPFQGPADFRADFAHAPSAWQWPAEGSVEVDFEDGQMRLQSRGDRLHVVLLRGRAPANLALCVQLRFDSGQGAAGVVLRRQDAGNHYQFVLSSDGRATIGRSEDGHWTAQSDWQAIRDFRAGASHELRIIAQGGGLAFYVDGAVAGSLVDTRFSEGSLGLFAKPYGGDGRLTVAFEELAWWEL